MTKGDLGTSEVFGQNHGHEQVGEKQKGHDADDYIFHKGLLHFFAGQGVEARDDEEQNDDSDIDKVAHKILVQFNSVTEAT